MSTDLAAALNGISVLYATPAGPVRALAGVDMAFPRGSSTAIVGRSGSGKSTLVSVLALLRRPTAGNVVIDGTDAASLGDRDLAAVRSRAVGIVFQSFHLEPSLSAAENIALPWAFRARQGRRRAALERAGRILDRLGVGELADRRPGAMSGGQRQRVAIARALFADPTLFIADEPTGNLDEDTANVVARTILDLPQRFGTTVVVVTHDRTVAGMAERRLELARGQLVAAGASA